MSSSRSSRLASGLLAVLAAFVLVASVATPVAAVSTSAENVPDKAKVGNEVTSTFTLTELYTDYEQWTLHGETELESVTWTVVKYDQAGNQLSKKSYDGQSFDADVSLSEGVNKVDVKVTGTVPEVAEGNFSYAPAQTFEFATLSQVRQGGSSDELDTKSVHHYTEESLAARQKIQQAEAAITAAEGTGADVTEANSTLASAISSFENGNFPNAETLAGQAQTKADDAKQQKESSEQTSQLLLYAGGAVVLLVLLGGGFFLYKQNQQDRSRL